jgi:hypothetical protein
MGELAPAKIDTLRMIFDAAPDTVVRDLCQSLSSDGPYDASLAMVRKLLDDERQNRRVRNTVFAGIAPLCRPGRSDRLAFPPTALKLIWRGLKRGRPQDVDEANLLLADWREDDAGVAVFDRLCAHAVEALERAEDGEFAAARAMCETSGAGSAAQLLLCLRLSAIVRRALAKLPDWLARLTGERAAELRLAYRDACDISEDAGPLFIEMLAGHVAEPWLVLRLLGGVMERPSEAYLAGSELSFVAERLLADLDERVAMIARFNANAAPAEARRAAQAIDGAVAEIAEIEQAVQLNPNGAWGRRVASQKRALAQKVEGHLKAMEDQVAKALPLQPVKLGLRSTRGVPRLTMDPEPLVVARAMTLLNFADEARHSASVGGYASARNKALETICTRIDQYVEDLLEHLRAEPAPDAEDDHDRAHAYLEVLAEFSALARDEKAASIVRRRAAAA